jgi:hypothetical protein
MTEPTAEPANPVPTDMADYWRDAIGESYQPVEWNPRHAAHPIRVKEVIAKLKSGVACPEAADIIVGLIHTMCVSQNIQSALSEMIGTLQTKMVDETHPAVVAVPLDALEFVMRHADFRDEGAYDWIVQSAEMTRAIAAITQAME